MSRRTETDVEALYDEVRANPHLGTTAATIFLAIGKQAGPNDIAEITQQQIWGLTGISKATLARWIPKLIAEGYLRLEKWHKGHPTRIWRYHFPKLAPAPLDSSGVLLEINRQRRGVIQQLKRDSEEKTRAMLEQQTRRLATHPALHDEERQQRPSRGGTP